MFSFPGGSIFEQQTSQKLSKQFFFGAKTPPESFSQNFVYVIFVELKHTFKSKSAFSQEFVFSQG